MDRPKSQRELKKLGLQYQEQVYPLIYEGKLKEAEENGNKALEIFTEIADKRQMAQSLNLLSIVYAAMGNAAMDLECLLEGLGLCMDVEAYDISAKLLNNIGSKFMVVKDFNHALYYFNSSIESFETACSRELTSEEASSYFVSILALNLAYVSSISGDLPKTRLYYEKAKLLSTSPGNEDLLFIFSAFEGIILWRLGEKNLAKKASEEILELAAQTEYSPDYMETMSYLIELLKEMRDFENLGRAITILDDHLREYAGQFQQLEVLNYWAEYYKMLGDEEKYREICIKYFECSREQIAETNLRTAAEIEMKAEMFRTVRAKKKADSIVFVDSLTQIGNRNKMLKDSKEYIKEALGNQSPIAIGLIDIDFFKECNDTYGHVEGDNCLKIVAKIIKDAVGDFGNVYRYGGDEFLLLLPDISVDNINKIGATIKSALEAQNIPNPQSPLCSHVTVSQGYTMAHPDAGDTIEWMISLADKALYTVKRSGKDNYKYIHFNDIVEGKK